MINEIFGDVSVVPETSVVKRGVAMFVCKVDVGFLSQELKIV